MRLIRFVNNITTTVSNEKKTKIKVVDLQKLNNFAVDFFLILNHLLNEKYV